MDILKHDTICAIATAQGGAIGIIRVSGPEAIAMADAVFRPKAQGKPLPGARRTHWRSAT